ncbi:uncharacterized protein [Oryctolagus cuniculus]|uniref:uncharacterized protein isoform X8 n=1 Tax=Oryctolagus cuniculus TaxID=9986 RepID=UPI00387A06C3
MRPAPTTVAGRAWGSAEPTGTCSPVFLLSFERIRGVDWKRGDIFGLWTQNNLFHGHKVSSCLEKGNFPVWTASVDDLPLALEGTQQFSGPTCSVSTLPLSLQCWSLFPVPLIAVGFCDCLDEWNKQKISVSWWKALSGYERKLSCSELHILAGLVLSLLLRGTKNDLELKLLHRKMP